MDTVLEATDIHTLPGYQETREMYRFARAVEAAVLAKLREQEPGELASKVRYAMAMLIDTEKLEPWQTDLLDRTMAAVAAPEAPAQPSVPAPWSEAVKVAREALKTCERFSVSEWEVVDMTPKIVRAALAQLDALEGGE